AQRDAFRERDHVHAALLQYRTLPEIEPEALKIGIELLHFLQDLDATTREKAGIDGVGVGAEAQVDTCGLKLVGLDVAEDFRGPDLSIIDHLANGLHGQDAGVGRLPCRCLVDSLCFHRCWTPWDRLRSAPPVRWEKVLAVVVVTVEPGKVHGARRRSSSRPVYSRALSTMTVSTRPLRICSARAGMKPCSRACQTLETRLEPGRVLSYTTVRRLPSCVLMISF